ncbi:efflux RND transporter periplasmic adaptor subunit [Myxococcota bacterium]|nr:efflux RND transporter periplasmic adaptor subunit [Myxococcota bacterium]
MTRAQIGLLGLVVALAGCGAGTEGHLPPGADHAGEKGEPHAGPGEDAGHPEAHGEGHEREEVALTPEAMRSAEIRLVTAERRPLSGTLTVPARFAFTQDGVVKVGARVAGRVAEIPVRLGQDVRRGQVLALMESPELGQARAEYLAAAKRAQVAETNLDRARGLVDKGISAARDVREAEADLAEAQAAVDTADARLHALGLSEAEVKALKADEHFSSQFPLRSPLTGTVVQVDATLGESVEGASHLFTVGDLSRLWAILEIAESDVARVRPGQPVALTVGSLPEARFEGKVDYVGDVVEEQSRTVEVRVAVGNPERALKPGMFATAEIAVGGAPEAPTGAPSAVVIPREAVQAVGGEAVVFVAVGPNRFRPVEVEVGATTASEAEVRIGLTGGETVVARGAFILKSELSKESMGDHDH